MIKTKTQTLEIGTTYICDVLKKETTKEDSYTFYNYCISNEAISLLPAAIRNDKDLVCLITHWFAHHHAPSFGVVDLNKGWWILTRNVAHNEFNNITNVKGSYPTSVKPKPQPSSLMSLADCMKEIATFEHGWESWVFHDGLLVKYLKNYAQPDVSKDLTHTKTFDGIRTDDDLLPISYLSRVENTKDGSLSYYLSTFKKGWGPFKEGQEVGMINLDFRTGRWTAVEKVHLSNGQLEADTFKLEGRLRIHFVDNDGQTLIRPPKPRNDLVMLQ